MVITLSAEQILTSIALYAIIRGFWYGVFRAESRLEHIIKAHIAESHGISFKRCDKGSCGTTTGETSATLAVAGQH